MRFDLPNPTDPDLRADYGLDPALGFFLTIFKKRRVVAEYDCLRRAYYGVPGLLGLLVAHGFLTQEDVILGGQELALHAAAEVEDPAVRLAATVIENLRAAANEE